MQIASSSQRSSLSHPIESIFLTIPWKYCFQIIQYILQYYIFFYPYRLQTLSLEYSSNRTEKPSKIHRSTSTSSVYITLMKNQRSISTQTNPLSPANYHNTDPINISEQLIYNSPKRRRFPFNRSALPSSSLFTNLFRHSPTTPIRSSESSTKSSISWGQRSSAASSSNQIRQPYSSTHYSSGILRRMESEVEPILPSDRRSRASTSSSSLLHTTHPRGSYTSTHYNKPLRREHYQSRSAYVLANSPRARHNHQQLSSTTTNTNSSDSSSVMHRYNSRLLSTIAPHQRVRDEDIVAANERKALRVLMIIFCVFVTLWTPFFICTFISAICDQCRERITSTVWFSITWLGYSSSMANPFIYTIFSDVFRRAFSNIIFCRSNDLSVPAQFSTKFSYPKCAALQYIPQHLSQRRSPNHDNSGTSTPIPLHHPIPMGGNDAMVYINRCASDTFR
jgi:hypothetical protein